MMSPVDRRLQELVRGFVSNASASHQARKSTGKKYCPAQPLAARKNPVRVVSTVTCRDLARDEAPDIEAEFLAKIVRLSSRRIFA